MSARDRLIGLAWNLDSTQRDVEARADRILAIHAHELAEKQRAHDCGCRVPCRDHSANLIDPEVDT